jgi:predicted negative regulator of RcsB-dependent stress response
VDRITRKELKQDKFAVGVTDTFGYLAEHRSQTIRYGVPGLVAVILIVAFFVWRSHDRSAGREALTAALDIRQAQVGPSQGDPAVRSFPTEEARTKAEIAAFSELAAKHSGSREGMMAKFYLGVIAADQGNLSGAETALKEVVDSADANDASLAKLSLAEVYKSEGKTAEGEQLIRSLIRKPTEFVSKEQATLALARYLASSNPTEARRLLEPLRTSRNAISRVALEQLGSLPK